jgi:hypothetical protein
VRSQQEIPSNNKKGKSSVFLGFEEICETSPKFKFKSYVSDFLEEKGNF